MHWTLLKNHDTINNANDQQVNLLDSNRITNDNLTRSNISIKVILTLGCVTFEINHCVQSITNIFEECRV